MQKKSIARKPIQFIVSTNAPCQLADINMKVSEEETHRRIDDIIRLMRTGPPELQLTENFEVTDLTPERVKRVFRLLDMFFYNNTLFPAIKQSHIRIFWDIFPFDQANFQPSLKLMAINYQGRVVEMHFMINLNRFHDSAKHRISNGIKARNKLEALCISGLHEIVHAIIYMDCPNEQGHEARFLSLNHKLHGADPKIYEYRDDVPPTSSK